MNHLFRAGAAALALAIVTTASPPRPDRPPAITLARTAGAAFVPPAQRKVIFVLIIGSDVRQGDPRAGRADSLHLLALNTKTGHGTLVGIPRDSYVSIPGSGQDKINAALYFGGPGRMVQTVSALAGVPIHYWALVEFSRFRRLVDALGGVNVNVPYKMADVFSGAFFNPGRRKMNGTEALAFSRARKSVPGGDFGRSENQGRLLVAAISKFKAEARAPLRLATYLRTFHTLVQTNVPTTELLALARIGHRTNPAKVRNIVLPGSAGNAGGASVVFLAPQARSIFASIRDDGVL